MTAYIDSDFYTNDYLADPVDDREFKKLAREATNIVDVLTHNRIYDFSLLPEKIKKKVQLATASLVESMVLHGGYDASVVGTTNGSVSIGTLSYNEDGSISGGVPQSSILKAQNCLSTTGLLHAGVRVSNDTFY